MKRFLPALIGLALLASPSRAADLSDQGVVTTKQLSTGATLVRIVFDLPNWQARQTHVIRHFCPPGVEMRSQGFSILPQPGVPSPGIAAVRSAIRLTNARNLTNAQNAEGFSWYFFNEGPANGGPLRLELSFIARRVVP